MFWHGCVRWCKNTVQLPRWCAQCSMKKVNAQVNGLFCASYIKLEKNCASWKETIMPFSANESKVHYFWGEIWNSENEIEINALTTTEEKFQGVRLLDASLSSGVWQNLFTADRCFCFDFRDECADSPFEFLKWSKFAWSVNLTLQVATRPEI